MGKLGLIILFILIAGCSENTYLGEQTTIKTGQDDVSAKDEIIGGETMGKNILMIIAPQNFRDEEFLEPKQVFEQNGFKVTVASKGVSLAKGKLGAKVAVDKDIADVKVSDYVAVVFVGGPGSTVFFNDEIALTIAKVAYEQGKIVAAICMAPSTLANAGILEGKKATSFVSEKDNLETKGAHYTGQAVTKDGNIITGNGPGAATDFGNIVVEALK